jgi:hypothetical protein
VKRLIVVALLGLGSALLASAAVPEIDPGSGANALALVAAAILIVRGRRRAS